MGRESFRPKFNYQKRFGVELVTPYELDRFEQVREARRQAEQAEWRAIAARHRETVPFCEKLCRPFITISPNQGAALEAIDAERAT